jgi:rhodanese-related sulfurtransferase
VAAEFNQQGFVNAKALLGGVAAWQQAGLPVVAANP